MERAEKGVLIPVDSRPIYTVGKHQRVKKMGVSLAGRGVDKGSADSEVTSTPGFLCCLSWFSPN
jgi:hypothetical protein